MTNRKNTPPVKAQRSETSEPKLKRYRVVIQARDWFEVHVLAPDEDAALDCAEQMDGAYVGEAYDQDWKAIRAELLGPYDEFSPPDLPASAWTVPLQTGMYQVPPDDWHD